MNRFDAAMAPLRARFAVRAAEDLRKLGGHQSGALPLPPQELHALVHRLAGSAGLFGFDEISRLAGQIDDQLADGDDAPALQNLVTALQAVVLENEVKV